MSYLLCHQLSAAQSDGLFHQHANGKHVGVEEEVSDQRHVSTLPRRLDHLADRVRAVTLESRRPHDLMRGRIRAAEATCFNTAVKTMRLDGQNMFIGLDLGSVHGNHAKRLRNLETLRILVDRIHLLGAADLFAQLLDRETNGAAAPDADDVAFAHLGKLDAVPGRVGNVGEGKSLLRGHVLGALEEHEVGVGHAAELGLVAWVPAGKVGVAEDAGQAVAVQALHLLGRVGLVAERVLLVLAVEALAAGDDGQDDDTFPGLEVLDLRPDFLDVPDRLVAQDVPWLHRHVHLTAVHVQV